MSDRNSVNGTINGGLGDALLGRTHADEAALRAPSLRDAAARGSDEELHRSVHVDSVAVHTGETASHDASHGAGHDYGHVVHSPADSMDLISGSSQSVDSAAGSDGSQVWTPQYTPLESLGSDHLGGPQLGSDFSGEHLNGAPPPAVTETGQLWEADAGTTAGNPDGHSDVRLEHDDSDGVSSDQIDEHDFTSAGALNSVGLDPAADLWFTVDNNDVLHVGHISTGAEIGSGTTIASTSDQDLVWSMVVDPRHDVIYEELFGGDYHVVDAGQGGRTRGGEIIKISYNPATGAITTPYNPSTFANDPNSILADSGSSGNKIALVRSMALSADGSTMYFAEDNDGDPGSFWGFTTNGIYSMSTSGTVGGGNAPTPTLLTTAGQFPSGTSSANYTNGYITALAVNNAQGIIYFTTDATGENVNTSQNAIYWMSTSGGTATKMTLPSGVTLQFDAFFSSGVTFDPAGRQLYVSDVQRDAIIQLTLSADGHSFASGTNTFRTVDTNGDGAFTSSMTWDSLPVLGNIVATTTEAVQGGSALTLLNGTPTISDPDGTGLNMNKAQVVIANAQTGDVLTANTTGTSITASYNTTTHTLTLTGNDTYAHYEQVLNTVQYQDTGTDNSTGSHPTRTIDVIITDGTTVVSQTTLDPNEKAITLVIDRAPTLTADSYAVLEGATATGTSGTAGTGVLGNDNDKDADAIVVTAVQGSGANVGNSVNGTYGHLTLSANGSYSYVADNTANIDGAANGSHPVDTFTYTVSDGLGGVTTSTMSFTIDRAPTVVADAPAGQALESGSAIAGNVLTNDSDKDGDILTVTAVNGGANVGAFVSGTYGQIKINSDGSYTYSANNTAAIDGAATGSHLTDTFTYTANDAHGGTTTTTIVVTIDRAPTVAADSGAAVESSSGTGNVLTNDSDRDGDTLVVSAVNGSAGNIGNSVAGTYGHITIASNGSYTYNADNTTAIDSAATGSHLTDTFSYTASDGHGGTTTTNIVITLDRAPTVVADTNTAVESASGSGNVLTNDSDRDGDTLAVSAVNGSAGNIGNSVAGTYGHLTVAANGSYTYNADNTAAIDSAATGSHLTDTFSYTASDGHGGTTTTNIVITLDRAPTVVGDSGAALEGASGTGNVLTNDSDRDGDTLVVSAVNGSGGNVGTSVAGTYGHITVAANGSYTYNADNTAAIDGAATGSHLTDTFSYTASDGHGGTTTTNVVITLDRGPTVTADTGASQALEGVGSVNGNVLANDSDRDGDTLVVSAVAGSAGNVGVSVAGTYGHFQIAANGTYSYSADNTAAIDGAATGSHLTDTVTYTANDGFGGTATTTLTVTLDRAPTVVADANTALEAGSDSGNVLTNDSDRDGDTLVVSAVAGLAGNVGTSTATTYGHITINADGSYTYTADNTGAIDGGATGSHLTDTVSYTASDGFGGTTTTNIVITLDRAPTVVADNGAAVEGASGTGNVLTNDSDRDGDTLVVSAVAGLGGNVGTSIATTYGHVTINSDGSYTYTADNTAAIDGAATGSHLTDTISYTASDGHGGTTTTNLVVTLDRGPTVANDTGSATEGGSATANAASGVLANDSDRDGDTLVVSAVSGSAGNVGTSIATTYGHITLNADGSYSYAADNTAAIDGAATGSHPIDTITLTVSDGHGGSTNETLSFTIDRLATASNDTGTDTESSTLNVTNPASGVLANDTDKDGDAITVTAVNGSAVAVGHQITLASGALLTLNADGTYLYDPNHVFDWLPDFASSGASNTTATDTFMYTIDGGATAIVTITIHGQDSNDTLVGTVGNDTLNGGVGDDIIYDDNGLNHGKDAHDTSAGNSGGIDSLSGGAGNDAIYMGGNLIAADHLDGGTNTDRVILNGDYSAGVTFNATTMVNVEILGLVAGHDYNLTMDNATVTAGQTLKVQAGTLGAGDNLTFDASNDTTGGSYTVNAGSGDDVLTGGIGNDHFRPGTGIDTVRGMGGDDKINFGANLTAADTIDGGNGTDTLVLKGDYSAGVTFTSTTLANVESIYLASGFVYNLTMDAATVAVGDVLTLRATSLGVSDSVTFDGSADVAGGAFVLNTGDGNDVLTGGNGDDTFRPGSGTDTVHGGGGDDTINMGNALTAADTIDGGTGSNTLILDGNYGANLTLGSTTMTNIQLLSLGAGHDYNLTLNALNVASGATLMVKGENLGASDKITFDGSALGATTTLIVNAGAGNDILIGGAGNDVLRGGSGNNTYTGGGGADTIFAGPNNDTFVYTFASESTSTTHDTIHGFDPLSDHFKITGWAINAVNPEVTTGHLNAATFDADLAAAITGAQLGAHDAVLFDPNRGDLHHHIYLIVDLNGVAGYQAGQDLVIDVTDATHLSSLTAGNFTT